ncbi:lipopolysaccharide export system protein LptC [Albimonas donghaensis]|uniref:Lipopolysaccharide export system protein LptC n=1 Tax=Albimonas donghaensis TaxID=356660 RepID=A0A1H3E2V0_9RHOB|nr:LPS export ABC transporter periplasmic protein LptC [Albimonas donghaensis]SDX73042.1 lipopolysaccharide export system protein LptC [Albimonas donghaensis]
MASDIGGKSKASGGSGGYSRLVRWAKIGLPLLALALLSALFLIPQDKAFEGGLVYSTADLISLGEGLQVTNPRIEGATATGEPFVVEADSATPDGPDPSEVELSRVRGVFEQAGGAAASASGGRDIRLLADTGVLRPRDQALSLTGAVRLETSDGYVVTTDRITADLRAGRAEAPGPVEAIGPQGSIASGSFRAERRQGDPAAAAEATLGAPGPGDYLWFENGVRVVWKPSPPAP